MESDPEIAVVEVHAHPHHHHHSPQDPPAGGEDPEDDGIGPEGRWKYGLFDCGGFTPLCIMGTCCDCVVWGQVMTRLGLNWCAMPDPVAAGSTFAMVVLIFFSFWASLVMVFGVFLTPCFLFYMILIFTKTRYMARSRFNIAPEYCQCGDGLVEDCLCANICTCCVSIQIARDTHDEQRYPYQYSTPTGLPENAPPLVAGMSSFQ